MNDVLAQLIDEAVHFVPATAPGVMGAPIRVARTLITCSAAVAVLNALRVPEEREPAYRYVNVHNPRCPLEFDRDEDRWRCRHALDDHPVWGINWAAAQLICRHLGGRLPRVQEWECFASNNDPTRLYPWGNTAPSHLLANYDEHYGGTSVVGSFPPSELGLYDLAGNLGEWCHDPCGAAQLAGPLERVVKGGAWSKDARHLRIRASRGKWERLGTTTIGVRPVWND